MRFRALIAEGASILSSTTASVKTTVYTLASSHDTQETGAQQMTDRGATMAVTDDSFSHDVLSSSAPVLVDFWAPWCRPCKMMIPVLEEIAREKAAELRVVKLDVDANPNTAQDFEVASIPTIILFKDCHAVKRIVGTAALLRELSDAV